MKKHTKIYMAAFGYDISDFIPCEICGSKGVDIHHIEARGMGGTNKPDHIGNLMSLCRECHIEYGDIQDKKEFLKSAHGFFIKHQTPLRK